jgi:5-methylcytosine-specific restriction enzyme A
MTEYRHSDYYKSRSWKKRRAQQLRKEPLCAMCLAVGKAIPATVADHIVPHRGDWNSFRSGALQSLCKAHHDSAKWLEEGKAYSSQIGADGWPVDPRHPVYGHARPTTQGNDPLDPLDLIG